MMMAKANCTQTSHFEMVCFEIGHLELPRLACSELKMLGLNYVFFYNIQWKNANYIISLNLTYDENALIGVGDKET